MTRDNVLALLRAHKATPAQRFGVTDLALFGSFTAVEQARTAMSISSFASTGARPPNASLAHSSISKTYWATPSIQLPTASCAGSCVPASSARLFTPEREREPSVPRIYVKGMIDICGRARNRPRLCQNVERARVLSKNPGGST